jgi:hypothetical protein
MGQAAVDLPDPLQQPSATGAKNADDLLSQLAGDEIDRLLAKSTESPADAPAAADAANAPAATVDEVDASGAVLVPPHAVEDSADPSAVDLDAVLATAAATPPTPPAEQAALSESMSDHPETDNSPPIELGTSRIPLFLRPLEWLSAPLDPWPDQLRDALGKIGLLTLVNALGVLAYVLLFRKHH